MYHGVKHKDDCIGLALIEPRITDCTCGRIIESLLAERDSTNAANARLIAERDKYSRMVTQLHRQLHGSRRTKGVSPA